jgi:hypothetical protein
MNKGVSGLEKSNWTDDSNQSKKNDFYGSDPKSDQIN